MPKGIFPRKPLSEEHKKKISLANSGRIRSPEVIERIASKLRGRKQPPEYVQKRRLSMLGKKNPAVALRMKLNNPMRNPETLKRMLATKKANNKTWKLPPRSRQHSKNLMDSWTEDRKKSISIRMKLNNPMKNPEVVKKSQDGQKEFMASGGAFGMMWRDPIKRDAVMKTISAQRSTKEYREKKSEWATKRMIECKMRNAYSKTGFFNSAKNGKQVFYRSSMERDAYIILENDMNVASYKNEPFHIPYEVEGIIKNYVPDILVFYSDGSKILIEVKPSYRFKYHCELIKIEALEKYSSENSIPYAIWTEKEIYGK